jgi:ferrous iron transport protein A
MNILEVENGHWARVINLHGGCALASRLSQMGFLPGNKIRVIRAAPFKGPVLLEVEGREIVLGRGVARQILVEVI